jgi:hypothetical protein
VDPQRTAKAVERDPTGAFGEHLKDPIIDAGSSMRLLLPSGHRMERPREGDSLAVTCA